MLEEKKTVVKYYQQNYIYQHMAYVPRNQSKRPLEILMALLPITNEG